VSRRSGVAHLPQKPEQYLILDKVTPFLVFYSYALKKSIAFSFALSIFHNGFPFSIDMLLIVLTNLIVTDSSCAA